MSEATTRPVGSVDASEDLGLNLQQLGELARQAYEQKRTKNCLDLTRAILMIDPANAEAQLMRSAIRSEMHRDLEDARALLRAAANRRDEPDEDAVSGEAPPDRIEASTASAEEVPTAPVQQPAIQIFKDPLDQPVPNSRHGSHKVLKLAAALALFAVGLALAGLPIYRTAFHTSASIGPITPETPKPVLEAPVEPPAPVATFEPPALQPTATLMAATPLIPDRSLNPPSLPAQRAAAPPAAPSINVDERPAVPVRNGTLAVSSATSMDIYIGDRYMGSAPASLELPAGRHTVEYRHGALIKTLTHEIKESETTRAMVSFDAVVSINANPWANVFVDGIERKPLGQTPLSGVRVPIGAVLVFENPKFQGKKYRVTGNESGIQIVFP